MATPDRVVVGPDGTATAYERATDHFLVKLRDDVSPGDAAGAFAAAGLATAEVPDHVAAARATLEPAGYAWVELPAGFDSATGAIDLDARDEVDSVLPVFFVEGEGPESAASPMVDVITVRPADDADADEVLEAVAALGLVHDDAASRLLAPHHVFNVAGSVDADTAFDLLEQVRAVDGVDVAEFDWLKLRTYEAAPDDTHWIDQWNMATIDLAGARDVDTGSGTVWIAVIDSDFDLTHPDISYTTNTGANPTHFNADEAIAGDPPPYDASSVGVFHGTACAGIAGAVTDNGAGVAGVGGGCRVVPVRLGTVPTANRVAAGINWATTIGAHVASLSLGTTSTTALNDAVAAAWTAGMVLCAATGNSGGNATSPAINFPASHADVIAVGASDRDDERKRPASSDGEGWGSQFDAGTDVVAPGVNIWTTDEQGISGYNVDGGAVTVAGVDYPSAGDAAGDYFSVFNGTSAATPHVAGLAGLLRSADPSLTNAQVRDLIESTCDKVSPGLYAYATVAGRPNGTWHQEVGYGRINAHAALCAAVRSVELTTPSIVFNDIPEGELGLRAASFAVRSCEPVHLQITAGPAVTSGPGTFHAFLGVTSEVVAASPGGAVARLWFSFTGEAPGTSTTGQVEVHCPETGQSWTITMSANSITAPATAVVMVLDQSGSMTFDAGDGRERIDVLKDSAPVLPGLLDGDDAIGVVAFDHDAYPRQAVVDVAAGGAIGAAGQIASHTPNVMGRTSIGDGVALARTALDDPAVGQPNKAIVVLTDGRENEPLSITAASTAIDSRVFAIGLGAPEHIDPGALIELTDGTGGYTLVTGTFDQDDHFTLQKYYLQILAGVTNAEVVLDPDGFVAPGAVHTVPFAVTERDRSIDVVLLSPSPEALVPELEAPTGDVLTPATVASAGGRYVVGTGFAAFRLPLPAVAGGSPAHDGTWTLHLSLDERRFQKHLSRLRATEQGRELELAMAHGLRYSANVHARSDVRMSAHTRRKDPRPGAPAELVVTFAEAGRPLERAVVHVEVTQPDGQRDVLALEPAGDAHRVVLPCDLPGVLRCRVLAKGRTFRGSPVQREQLVTVAVWDPDRLAPDLDPPRTEHDDPSCRAGLEALVRILDAPTSTAKAVATALHRAGHDHRAVVACLAKAATLTEDAETGRAGDGHREAGPIAAVGARLPQVLRELAAQLES